MAAEIDGAYPKATVKLIESSGGVFEVHVNGDLVFSKRALGRHAAPGEVMQLLHAHLGS